MRVRKRERYYLFTRTYKENDSLEFIKRDLLLWHSTVASLKAYGGIHLVLLRGLYRLKGFFVLADLIETAEVLSRMLPNFVISTSSFEFDDHNISLPTRRMEVLPSGQLRFFTLDGVPDHEFDWTDGVIFVGSHHAASVKEDLTVEFDAEAD